MYRLLIVDDNSRDLRIIKGSIPWGTFGVEVAAVVADGSEALRLARQEHFDLVLTDISMPGMNGIELARALRDGGITSKVIFMSFYEDFEYARSAVDLHIYGYVLKPIDPEKLRKLVCEVLDICASEVEREREREAMLRRIHDSLPVMREEFLRQLIFGRIPEPEDVWRRIEFLELPIRGFWKAQVVSVRVLAGETAGRHDGSAADDYLRALRARDLISEALIGDRCGYLVTSSPEEYVIIFFFHEVVKENQLCDAATALCQRAKEELGIGLSIGMSTLSRSLADAPLLYQQSQQALHMDFYCAEDPIILYREIADAHEGGLERKIELARVFEEVSTIIASRDAANVDAFIDRFFSEEGIRPPVESVRVQAIIGATVLQLALMEHHASLSDAGQDLASICTELHSSANLQELQDRLRRVFHAAVEHLARSEAPRDQRIALELKSTIRRRFAEPLSVSELAERVNLSFRHANAIFLKETGTTIFGWLTRFRIGQAQALLRDPASRIAHVAEAVGYRNASHFCMVFKRVTGVTPAEYRAAPRASRDPA